MNIERLQALSARLRTVDPNNFTLRGWIQQRGDGSVRRCTACVAASMPQFNLLGYVLWPWPYDNDYGGGVWPVYGDEHGLGAFREFFGFNFIDDAHYTLTSAEHDAPPSVIADRIDAMIAAELLRRGESPVTESTDAALARVDAEQMECAP